MKRLLLIIIFTLSFQHIANADDINDFQIEGMSIGDSLLNFFKKEDIETEKYDEHSLMYKNNKYVQIGASYKKSYRLNIKSKTYDDLSIVLKTIDDTYKIYLLGGRIFCTDINVCKDKKNQIVSELKKFFSNEVIVKNNDKNHSGDPTGNSKSYNTYFNFKNTNAYVSVSIYDWSEKINKEKEWLDSLNVTIIGEDFRNFLQNVQYN